MKFEYEYAFLSNFHPCRIVDEDGLVWRSSEALYQSCKTSVRQQFQNLTPSQAKRLGRKVPLIADWDKIKDSVMEDVVLRKFSQNNDLKQLLLNTGDIELVEHNWWNDTYWGVCKGKGQNKLGLILMSVRAFLRFKQEHPIIEPWDEIPRDY